MLPDVKGSGCTRDFCMPPLLIEAIRRSPTDHVYGRRTIETFSDLILNCLSQTAGALVVPQQPQDEMIDGKLTCSNPK